MEACVEFATARRDLGYSLREWQRLADPERQVLLRGLGELRARDDRRYLTLLHLVGGASGMQLEDEAVEQLVAAPLAEPRSETGVADTMQAGAAAPPGPSLAEIAAARGATYRRIE